MLFSTAKGETTFTVHPFWRALAYLDGSSTVVRAEESRRSPAWDLLYALKFDELRSDLILGSSVKSWRDLLRKFEYLRFGWGTRLALQSLLSLFLDSYDLFIGFGGACVGREVSLWDG